MEKNGAYIYTGFGQTKLTATVTCGKVKKTASVTLNIQREDTLAAAYFAEWRCGSFQPIKTAKIDLSAEALNLSNELVLEPAYKIYQSACSIDWKSSNAKVAEVSSQGRLTLKAEGTTKITATVLYGTQKKTATLTLKVYDKYKPTKASFACGSKLTLYEYGDYPYDFAKQLVISATEPDTDRYTVAWSSSKPSVAYLTVDGKLQLGGKGTTKVTATVAYGDVVQKATCAVTVKETDLELSKHFSKKPQEMIALFGTNGLQTDTETVFDTEEYLWNEGKDDSLTVRYDPVTKKMVEISVTKPKALKIFGIGKEHTKKVAETILKKKGYKINKTKWRASLYSKGKMSVLVIYDESTMTLPEEMHYGTTAHLLRVMDFLF